VPTSGLRSPSDARLWLATKITVIIIDASKKRPCGRTKRRRMKLDMGIPLCFKCAS
jgi:hypothetical protein